MRRRLLSGAHGHGRLCFRVNKGPRAGPMAPRTHGESGRAPGAPGGVAEGAGVRTRTLSPRLPAGPPETPGLKETLGPKEEKVSGLQAPMRLKRALWEPVPRTRRGSGLSRLCHLLRVGDTGSSSVWLGEPGHCPLSKAAWGTLPPQELRTELEGGAATSGWPTWSDARCRHRKCPSHSHRVTQA